MVNSSRHIFRKIASLALRSVVIAYPLFMTLAVGPELQPIAHGVPQLAVPAPAAHHGDDCCPGDHPSRDCQTRGAGCSCCPGPMPLFLSIPTSLDAARGPISTVPRSPARDTANAPKDIFRPPQG